MAKKDKTDRKSFEDMSAEREADVKAGLEAASDRMADAQGEAMLANINRRIDGLKDRVKNTAINIGAPQSSLGIGREDIQGNADSMFRRGMNKSRFNVQKDLSEKSDAARQEAAKAASDRMADAQGEAMLANISRRIDEVKGEEGRKRNYHLLQQAAIRENENSRVKNTDVNVGAPQAPLNFEPEEISGNADRTFKRGMAKNQYGVRQDFGKRALAAETEAAIAASDKMADGQEDDALANIKSLIAKRERDIADRRAAEERKQKYLSDQQAAINANKKPAEVPATPAGGGQKKTEVPGKTDVPGEMENVRNGRAARAANYDASSAQEKPATPAGDVLKKAEVPGDADNQGGGVEKKSTTGSPAPIVHNAEERFKKNVEDVKENLKYEPVFDLIRKYEEERQKLADNRSESQKKKDARREKMAKIFAALGDGIAAMSNLVLASKGAIPYQSKSMLTKAVGDRYAQFRKDLENRKAKYLAMSERINELKDGVRKARDVEERQKAAQALAQAKLEAELYDKAWNRKFHKDEASRDQRNKDADRELKGKALNHTIENDNANLGIRKQQADAATTNADANATRAATFARNGGGGTRYEFDGKTYGNVHAYEAAIKQKAIQLGIPLKEDYEAIDQLGYTRTSKRDKKIDQLLAEVNERMAGYSGFGF